MLPSQGGVLNVGKAPIAAMSLLRTIMQNLRLGRPGDSAATSPADRAYQAQLGDCSDAMLLYEWEWLDQCMATEPEAPRWRQLLAAEMGARSLSPIRARGPVCPASHAWQIEDAVIRRIWLIH